MARNANQYTVHTYDGCNNRYQTCATLRAARSLAWLRANQVRNTTARPVWVDGGAPWNSETAIGGYDASGPGSSGGPCVVVHRVTVEQVC